jgi:hypothetical protein
MFATCKALLPHPFDMVAWDYIFKSLHKVPKMSEIFVCKQVFGVSCTREIK